MALHVVVAEDAPLIQQVFRDLLEAAHFSVVGQAYDGEEAVQLTNSQRPDIVILDHDLPRLNGVEAARAIARAHPGLPVILLTMAVTEYDVATALDAGVRGYVLKVDAAEDLVRAVREVARGFTFVSPGASRALCERYLPDG